jgi:DNA-binding NarL/FixJ family response regulator
MKRKAPRKSGTAPGARSTARVKDPITLVLIDDNRLLREGITRVVESDPGFKVLASSADADEALRHVREAKPDVVLVDFGLEDHDSLALTRTVHSEVPAARVIVMGLVPNQEDVAEYVQAGATGFVMKDASIEDFFATIRAVAAGAEVLPKALTSSLFSQIVRNIPRTRGQLPKLDAVRLTNRERQVVELLSEGLSNKETATRLHGQEPCA